MKDTTTRREYLAYRDEGNRDQILRLYFNKVKEYTLDEDSFEYVMGKAIDDHPGLEEDIKQFYPTILKSLDAYYNLNFLVGRETKTERFEIIGTQIKINKTYTDKLILII